jgi:hypothetical protein
MNRYLQDSQRYCHQLVAVYTCGVLLYLCFVFYKMFKTLSLKTTQTHRLQLLWSLTASAD